MIKLPRQFRFFERLFYKLHKFIIQKYDECRIPDIENEPNLSGDLSHKYPLPRNAKFIGYLSRFSNLNIEKKNSAYDVICILSGPENQRTIFENILIKQLKTLKYRALIIRGKPNEQETKKSINNITFINHIEPSKFAEHIISTKHIICRAGYSTIMDFVTLKKTALLVPTPGQTEQEYLAKLMSEKKLFSIVEQKNLNIEKDLKLLNDSA